MYMPSTSNSTLEDLDNVPEIDDDDDDTATDASLSLFPNDVIMPSMALEDTRVEGWLNHSTSKILSRKSKQSARFFVLRGETLSYYGQPNDIKAKGTFVLSGACSVGPVVYGPIEGTTDQNNAMEESCNDDTASTNTPNISNKSKKKKRQYYCVQVTWPTTHKPSKDEKLIAKAKAQVAAENEKKALLQQQLSEEDADDSSITKTKSPSTRSIRAGIHRRLPSTPITSFRKSNHASSSSVDYPPELPALDSDVNNSTNANGQEPTTTKSLPTLATTLAGTNQFKSTLPNAKQDENPTTHAHETGLQKHYTQQIEKHAKDQQKTQEELQKVMLLLSRKANHEKNKKRFIQGTKVAALSTAAITAGVLTAGMSLAAGLLFVGITAAAGGSGAVVGSKVYDKAKGRYIQKENQMAFRLVLAAKTYEEAMRWKQALESVIKDLAASEGESTEIMDDPLSWRIRSVPSVDGEDGVSLTPRIQSPIPAENVPEYMDLAPKWVPLQGGGLALWGILGFGHLRVYREERPETSAKSPVPVIPKFRADVGFAGQPFPPLRASVVLKAKSLDAFMCLMCSGRIVEGASPPIIPLPNSGQIASFRIIETINDHMDAIHLVFRPLYLFPVWSAPRDFVLYRFWKHDDDGSYQVCFDSCKHKDCPPNDEYVRGEMHSVYTIAPLKRSKKKSAAKSQEAIVDECLMTNTVQVDPRGWVPAASNIPFFRSQGYGDAFAAMALNQMLDVKDSIDCTRFVVVPMSNEGYSKQIISKALAKPKSKRGSSSGSKKNTLYVPTLDISPSGDAADASVDEEQQDIVNYDFNFSCRELTRRASDDVISDVGSSKSDTGQETPTIYSHPPPTRIDWWAEPDANSFRVRGKTYKDDGLKINAGSSIFRLIAADVIETDEPILNGMCLHPTERVQLALAREKKAKLNGEPSDMPPFVFCVNISIPGPPNYQLVFYYAVDDMSLIDGSDGTPSSKLCNEFFFEKDDAFRDNTFKLIPQVIEGNFMVRKAVGSTPAIMGNKIKQTYCRGDRFFELTIDTGSSSVAAGVMRICNGYCRMIVVDMAFLFEGYDESTLPERVLGCARLKNVEFGKKLRYVESV